MRRPALYCLFFCIFTASSALAQSAPQLARDYVRGPGGRLAVTIEPDNYPPDMPPNLSGSATGCLQISLSWGVPGDIGSGVAGYNVYRDSQFIGSTGSTSYTDDTGNTLGGFYTYEVAAYDAAGLTGSASGVWVEYPPCDIPLLGLHPDFQPKQASRFAHVRFRQPIPADTIRTYRVLRLRRIKLFTLNSQPLSGWAGGGQ